MEIFLYLRWKLIERRGHNSPLVFYPMIEAIEKIRLLTEQLLEGTDMFIVNLKVKPVNNVKVYLDADSGLSISKSAAVNRKLYAAIEAEQLFPGGDFSLEVSSPGIDEPLKDIRQYRKNTGRKILVNLLDGSEKLGVLKEVNEGGLLLEMKHAKKKEVTTIEIPFTAVEKAVIQISF